MNNIVQSPAVVQAWKQEYKIDIFNGAQISLKPADIPRYLKCEKASVEECILFIKTAQRYKADVWMRDMYLIKYGTKPASIVTGVGFFQKKAQNNPKFEGFTATEWLSKNTKAWVTCWIPSIHGATPLGCRVSCHVKGYREKQTFTVNWEENKKDTPIWRSMPSRMIEKVAMVGLLRQTFPADFAGLYIQEEIDGHSTPPEVEPYHTNPKNQISDSLRVKEGVDSFGHKKIIVESPESVAESFKGTLQEIADEDYRGNRSQASVKAHQVLKEAEDARNTTADLLHCDFCEKLITSNITEFNKHIKQCEASMNLENSQTTNASNRIEDQLQAPPQRDIVMRDDITDEEIPF